MRTLFTEHSLTSLAKIIMNRISRLYRGLKKEACAKVIVLAGLMMLAGSSMRGQSIANYAPVTQTTGIIYSSDSLTGNAFPAWRNNTNGNSNQDDNRSYPVNIGFDFWYNGTRYTQFSVSTNGFIDFSWQTFDGGPNSRPFGPYDADLTTNSQAGGTVLALAPLYFDLTTLGETDPLGNSIMYLTTGTAPNRVLTVEWLDMSVWTYYANVNFQVKLFESTGAIQFIYGSMTPGTAVWSYTLGINDSVLSASPTAAQLLSQQTANTTTFSNAAQNNLTTLPTANSMLTFTPPTPSNPTNLTFSNIQLTSMQLNWTDNANNEVGYVIYRSDDGGATYNFIHQLAANSTSSIETGLLPGTTYYWKVYAVTEGRLSAALLGSQATSPAPNIISAQTGPWNTGSTWIGGVVPAATANVTIADNTTVTLDGNDTTNSVTVGQGGIGATLIIGNSATARTLTVNGGITVNTGGSLNVNGGYSQTSHAINITGDIMNAGTFNMEASASSRCIVTFSKNGPQNIEGAGTTRFGKIVMNMGSSISNILDVSATNFVDTVAGFLTLSNGTFRISTAATLTPFLGNVTIPSSAGLWLYSNSPSVTIPDSLIVSGSLRVSSGVLTIGNAADERLMSNGGTFTIEGGTVNIAGRFAPYNSFATTVFTMSGGTLNVPTIGSTSTTDAPFSMSVAGSFFEMTGGTIVIKQSGGSNLGFLNTGSTTYAVTGGTVQIGDASTPSGQIIAVKSITPVYNLLVAGATPTATARLDTFLVVKNNLTINSGNVLNANTNNISVGNLWNDAGSFTPTTATATFNGTGAQTITKASSAETFNKLTIKNSASVSLGASTNAAVADSFQILQGTFAVAANTLTLNGAVTSSGTLTSGTSGTVSYNKSSAGQTVLAANYGNLTFSNFTKTLPSTGTVGVASTFTPGTAAGHTIAGSTVDFNGAGAQTIPWFLFNNLTVSTGGTKTLSVPAADTVQGSFTINSGVTFADGGFTLRVAKNSANSGAHTGTGSITFIPGSAAHVLSGTGSYTNLVMNDANGATLSNNLSVNGVLTFTSGIITTSSADTVVISSTGSVSRTSGHVNGNLGKYFPTGSNVLRLFEIGDATTFAPDTVTFASVTTGGNLVSSVTAGDNPNIASSGVDPNHSVNRYWKISNNGIVFTTYTATFDFVAGDIDAGSTTGTFIVAKFDAAWTLPTVGTRTGTSTQATGMNSIYSSGSSFAVGNVFTTVTNSYQSVATGAWNAPATWQRYNGAAWVAAAVAPDSTAQTITLQSGYAVTVTASTNADQLVVSAGAVMVINGGVTFTLHNGAGTDLVISGALMNGGTLAQGTATATVTSTGLYAHNTNNTANLVATWDPNSTCQFTGVTNALPVNLAQTFGNFTWNCPGQTTILNIAGVLTTIAGNFTMTSTGTGELDLAAAQSQTTTVGGSFSQTGGTFGLSTGNGTPTLSIAGNFSMSGGILRMKGSGGANTGVSTMNVAGNFSFTAGTISENSLSNAGKGLVVFNGTGNQTYTSGGTIANTDSIGFTVNNGASLYVGTSTIIGGGTFTLSNGATLGIGSTNGITVSGANGNIQTNGLRTYNAGANYVYNGIALQSTGNGLPSTVNKLTINNSAGANLTNSVQTDSLYLTAGAFNVNAAVTLTINNLVTVTTGSLTSATTGTVNYSKASNGQPVLSGSYGNLTFSNFNKILPSSGTVVIAGTFTAGTATSHTVTGSTVSFNGTLSQVIPAFTFNNLTLSNGWKGLGGNASVQGIDSISSGIFSDSVFILTVNGNVVNKAQHRGSGEMYFNGSSSAHIVSGGGTFGNIEINDGNGITTSGNLNINGTLMLTRGIITTGSDSVVINSGGNVNRAVSGLARHVFGNLKTYVPTGSPVSMTFHIGDAANYAPLNVTFASVSAAGYLVATTTGSNHPNIGISGFDITKNVSRYWTLKNLNITFTTYSITANFVSTDVAPAANTANFFLRMYLGGLWSGPTTTARTSSSTQAVGLAAFGDYAVGDLLGYFRWTGLGGNPYWNTPNNWSLNAVPTTANDVVLDTAAVIYNISADSCRSLTISNSGIQLTDSIGSLAVLGNLSMTNGTLNTRLAFPRVSGTTTLSGGIVGFTGTGAQTIPALNFYNLNVTGARTTNNMTLAGGTITIANSATSSATFTTGQWINTGNLVQYTGSGAQSIAAIGYNNLTISNARSANNITFSNSDTIRIAGTFTLAATFNSGYGYITSGTSFDFNGTGSQTVPCLAYNSLRISGVRTTNTVTLSSTDTIHVASVFSPVATFSSGGYQSTGTIFEYNGTSAQTIAPFNYNNLLISGARTTNNVTFASSGTVGIAGAMTMSATFTSGAYVTTGSTINYNGTGAQTVNAFSYNNLTISGARTSNYVTLASSDTIRIANAFSPSATFTSGDYVRTGSTISFNGSGAQTIPSFRYNNLQTATGGTKTSGGAITTYGSMIIGVSSTFDGSSNIDTLYGNWINNGTFTPTTSEIVFAGPSNSTVSGTTSFNNLTINKSSSTTNVALGSNIQVVNLSMTAGSMGTSSNGVTITSTRTGNGIILGTITRTHVFTAGTSYAFEGPNTTLNFNSGGTLPTSITVFVDTVSPGANTYMQPINRYYTISQTGGSGFTFTMRLHYQNSEVVPPNIKSTLKAWQRTSTGPDVWARLGATSIDSVNYWVENTGVTTVGTWSLSSTTVPNIVLTLAASAANPVPGDTVTYTISYSNTGDGSATNTVVSASTPFHTSYVANSVTVNTVPKTDAADADGVSVSSGNITVNLATVVGTIAPGGNGTITYRVTIN